MTPLTGAVQPPSGQHQICLNAGHSLRKAQQKILVTGLGPTSCNFPYHAKGNTAYRRNCRTRVSIGSCHQCQQNYTPRETEPFKSGRYFKDYFKKVSKGNITHNTWYSLFPRSQENLNSRNGLFPLWRKMSWQSCWIPGRESRQILVLFCLNSNHAPRNCFISGLLAMELDQMEFLKTQRRKCETMACSTLCRKLRTPSC